MPTTVLNQNYGLGKPESFPEPWVRQFRATVYQGDQTDATRFQNSAAYAAGTFLPTGAIASIDSDNGLAVAGCKAGAAGNHPVPYLVYVGNDKMEVQSEYMNVSGGLVTLLPCTGYYRVRTTVFDKSEGVVYKANDLLTVKELTVGGKATAGVTKTGAKPYETVTVGIVDSAVGLDHSDLETLSFTCYFLPAKEA